MERVAIVEFNNFHDEVVLAQSHYLAHAGIEAHLILNPALQNRSGELFAKSGAKVVSFGFGSRLERISAIKQAAGYIKKNGIDTVVFNTAECPYAKALSLLLPRQKKLFVAHNLDRLKKSRHRHLVLSRTLLERAKSKWPAWEEIDYFYPFVDPKQVCKSAQKSQKLTIAVPGSLELGRRDYFGLVEAIARLGREDVEFVLLGDISKNDGPKILEQIRRFGIQKKVRYFHGFVDHGTFFARLCGADAILPLIHPNVPNFAKYHGSKITAAFTWSLNFKIPMLLYASLAELSEYAPYAVQYTMENFLQVLESLDRSDLAAIGQRMGQNRTIEYGSEQKRYIELLKR